MEWLTDATYQLKSHPSQLALRHHPWDKAPDGRDLAGSLLHAMHGNISYHLSLLFHNWKTRPNLRSPVCFCLFVWSLCSIRSYLFLDPTAMPSPENHTSTERPSGVGMCRQVLGSRDKGVSWHDIFSLFDHIFTLGGGVLVLMGFNLFPFLLTMK